MFHVCSYFPSRRPTRAIHLLQLRSSQSRHKTTLSSLISTVLQRLRLQPRTSQSSKSTPTMSTNEALKRVPNMGEIFAQHEDQNTAWEALWQSNTTPWDRGVHNPALEDTLREKTALLGKAVVVDEQGKTRRKKALVPGCGRGVDVFLLAEFGYDAYGLECSETALDECKKQADKVKGSLKARDEEVGMGTYRFLDGDFFKDGWLKEAGLEEGCFDLIYDYTVSCHVFLSVYMLTRVDCSSSARCTPRCVHNGLSAISSYLPHRPLATSSALSSPRSRIPPPRALPSAPLPTCTWSI